MNIDLPKISVVMPVYNTKEEYLREDINSSLKLITISLYYQTNN